MAVLKKIWPYLLLFFLSLFTIYPLFNPGFFPMHDDTQPARVYEMAKSLTSGMFPVRWVPDLGYGFGYPIFNFYAPLAYYIGAIFMLVGLDVLVSTKIMMGLGVILSAFSMYLLAKEFWGKIGGLVSGLLYLYFPYHAANLYVRGAVAEFWAYVFIPIVFFGFYKLFKENKFSYLIIAAFGYAGVILSHNLTALMVTLFLFIFLLILVILNHKAKRIRNSASLIFAVLLSLLISAFYWMPAFFEMGNTNVISTIGGGADYKDHFVCLNQLWYSSWGFGGSVPGCIDGISFVLGKVNIFILLAAIIGFFVFFKNNKNLEKERYALISAFVGFVFSVFLLLSISRFAWDFFPFMKYFQYPWRFLNLVGFFMAFISGSVVIWLNKMRFLRYAHSVMVILLLVVIVSSNLKFFSPQEINAKSSNDYISTYALKWEISKISDEYLPMGIVKPIDSEQAQKNDVIFSFSNTPLQTLSNLISIAGIAVLLLGIILSHKNKL